VLERSPETQQRIIKERDGDFPFKGGKKAGYCGEERKKKGVIPVAGSLAEKGSFQTPKRVTVFYKGCKLGTSLEPGQVVREENLREKFNEVKKLLRPMSRERASGVRERDLGKDTLGRGSGCRKDRQKKREHLLREKSGKGVCFLGEEVESVRLQGGKESSGKGWSIGGSLPPGQRLKPSLVTPKNKAVSKKKDMPRSKFRPPARRTRRPPFRPKRRTRPTNGPTEKTYWKFYAGRGGGRELCLFHDADPRRGAPAQGTAGEQKTRGAEKTVQGKLPRTPEDYGLEGRGGKRTQGTEEGHLSSSDYLRRRTSRTSTRGNEEKVQFRRKGGTTSFCRCCSCKKEHHRS